MDLSVTVGVLTSDKKNFAVRNCESTACPERILHSHGKHLPLVLVDFVHFDGVIDFLFGTSKESSKSVDVLICHRASTQVVSLVLHRRNLIPLVLPNVVLLYRAKPLLA